MKMMLLSFALISTASTQAFAFASCGQMIARKAELAAKMAYLSEKINSSMNEDKIELYMDEYETLQARYLNVVDNIEYNCK